MCEYLFYIYYFLCYRKISCDPINTYKKIKFTSGTCVKYISREDFVSEASYRKFLEFAHVQRSRLVTAHNKNLRRGEKLQSLSAMITNLKEKQETVAANFLQVTT